MKSKIHIIVMAIGVLLSGGGNLSAKSTMIEGVRFRNAIEIEEKGLRLTGVAMLRYLIFMEAYAGALYLPEGMDGSQALDNIVKYLELEYRVSISADDFAKATRQKIKASVTSDVFNRITPELASLNRLYQSVEPGDRYALAYVPGKGTQLIYNTTPLGVIGGAEFAAVLFGIWIGDDPIDEDFRDRLLGEKT